MYQRITSDLERFGALPSQLVDLGDTANPRILPYLDLTRSSVEGERPVVFEVQRQPRAYIFDGRDQRSENVPLARWVRRVAFRGDAAWVGVLRPGRLDFYRAVLDGERQPQHASALPQGPFLFPSLVHERESSEAPNVRAALLALLRGSIQGAVEMGVDGTDALSLVGRALFWRFLVDRNLLAGIDPTTIAKGATDLHSCIDSKTRALDTFEWLDHTFNGGLLAFSSPKAASQIKASVYERVVGNIAHGAIAGQLELRLPKQWREVNFTEIPVGLLSEVYEAFAHQMDADRARKESVFYTPRHLAEFVVHEALESLGQTERPRVLDPASGAGVFLVAAFRALVAREWARIGRLPDRSTIRSILNKQLTGFDINDTALRLSELALYLTAIELDPDPRPRPLELLRFTQLRSTVLFLRSEQDGSLGPVEARFKNQFDVIVGNPPWTATGGTIAKKRWVKGIRPQIRELLGQERAAEFDFPDANPDLPFVLKATEWAAPRGVIAIITHARWLFGQSKQTQSIRKVLFDALHITGVLNGTALRMTSVWPNVSHPFCVLFARNEKPPEGARFQFVSPMLDRAPDRLQSYMRIDWADAQEISCADVLKRPWLLKARFRGTSLDEMIIEHLQRIGTPFGTYLESLGTELRNGYIEAARNPVQFSARELAGVPDFKRGEPAFFIDAETLPRFTRKTLHRPRARETYRAPLLIVHESMRQDPLSPRSMLALEDVLYDDRFSGISFFGIRQGAQIAPYLQLLIQSSAFQHALLMLDAQFGVEREVVHMDAIEQVPVVAWSELDRNLRERARDLAKRLRGGITTELREEIDAFAADVLGLSDVQRDTVADTLAVGWPTSAAKRNATRSTTEEDRRLFVETCQAELQELVESPVAVVPAPFQDGPWHFMLIANKQGDLSTELDLDVRALVQAADEASASVVTIARGESETLVGMLDQYRYWTRTRARLMAASIVAEQAHG